MRVIRIVYTLLIVVILSSLALSKWGDDDDDDNGDDNDNWLLSLGVTVLYGKGIYTFEDHVPIDAIRAYHRNFSADVNSDTRYVGADGISKGIFVTLAVQDYIDLSFGYERVSKKETYGETPLVQMAGGGHIYIRGWTWYEGNWYYLRFKYFLPIGLSSFGTFCPGIGGMIGGSSGFTGYIKCETVDVYNLTTRAGRVSSFYDGTIKFRGGLAALFTLDVKYVLPKLPITLGAEYVLGVKGNGAAPTKYVEQYDTQAGSFVNDGEVTNITLVSGFKKGTYFYATIAFFKW
ncbi:MAG: hypothetical protein N3A63_01145 [Bacteroidetes bacterium]|nr:hypothetical protein [Bacteroidota bacterium]